MADERVAPTPEISADFPFEPRFVEVHGSRMHYVDEGEGDPVLFLHGNPTSSYLWRNVLPHVKPLARVIAPDLIGMGRSDKPDITYRFFDHSRYLEGFIEALGLENLTLVLHDWGAGLGLHYARRHQGNVQGLAFMEGVLRPLSWRQMPAAFRVIFRLLRAPLVGWLLIVAGNLFVRRLLPQAIVRPLRPEEKARYAEPFRTWASRRPVRRWPLEIPIDGHPAEVHEAVAAVSRWLPGTEIPKLFLHARPGAINPRPMVEWVKGSFEHTRVVEIGKGLHYIQEDQPHTIGAELAAWYRELGARGS